MNQYLRPATVDDVEYVAQHMRQGDIEEVGALGFSPLESLTRSFERSDIAYTLLEPDQTPCGVAGICPSPLGASWGAIWLLGTSGIESNSIAFLRHSRASLRHLFEASGKEVLYNYTYDKNVVHHRWLRWLGFKFLRRVELPPFQEGFIEFAKLRG